MWISAGENRWDWNADDDRHLLLLGDAGVLGELHGQFLHRYRAVGEVNPDSPLDGATHIDTVTLPDQVDTDEQGWGVLAAAVAG